MRIIDLFEKIYIINLPDRRDRFKAITRELEKFSLPLLQGKVEVFPAIRPDSPDGFPSIGARGCFLSHMAVLEKAKRSGLSNVLIMEDDLSISPLLKEYEATIVEQLLRLDWDIVYFGHSLDLAPTPPGTLQTLTDPVMCAHFYGLNGSVFDRLYSFLQSILSRPPGHPDGGPMHLDGAYCTFREQNADIRTLAVCPSLGKQRSSRSDIHENRWFDQWPGIKQVTSIARLWKEELVE